MTIYDELVHYGTPRRSGRYPWGSGEDPQRNKDFLSYVTELEKDLSEQEVANALDMTVSELRKQKSNAKQAKKASDISFALRLKEKGVSNVEIGRRLGKNESYVRTLLDPALQEKNKIVFLVADELKRSVERNKYIDVGLGSELAVGVSKTKFDNALKMLTDSGYKIQYLAVQQVGTGKNTSLKVLTKDDVTAKELYQNRFDVKTVDFYATKDKEIKPIGPIVPVSSDRVFVRYTSDKDGLIELRSGVEDIDLGAAKYAQVRIGVDGDKYLKGMAIMTNDIPDGYDIVFNTSKKDSGNKKDAFKDINDDPESPFKSTTRPKTYIDKDGNERTSPINIVNEEGDWTTWSKSISSQVLSKQRPELAKKQLSLKLEQKLADLEEIKVITNPEVKRSLMEKFADEADSSAVHLKAAALPRQKNKVIIPITELRENEVYAPGYKNGETLALIRHPHGGVFEIPEVIVNNRNRQAKDILGDAEDAIGINPAVAKKLSGADFDGDTVIAIPNNKGEIKTGKPIESLVDFDPKAAYPYHENMRVMTKKAKQLLMGDVSNLITDMTIRGATREELARAVRHSMVVIDAEKHKLNYIQSAKDNGIASLKQKYQGSSKAGAATLISKASSQYRVNERQDRYRVDPITGDKIWFETNRFVKTKSGKEVRKQTISTKMAEERDARNLSSGTRMENIYADYANQLKDLARKVRLEAQKIESIPYSPTARLLYKEQVNSLKAKLEIAKRNKPLERAAQLLANKNILAKKVERPDMDPDELKTLKGKELTRARIKVGSGKAKIVFTEDEWRAVQEGAITKTTLKELLLNADLDQVRQLSMPRTASQLASYKKNRAIAMLQKGYDRSEIADALGVSISLLDNLGLRG